MGSHISEEQCKELERAPFRRFVIATDNDEAGRKGASQIKRLLIPKGFRFTNLKWNTQLKDINDLAKEYGDGFVDYLTGY
jgi:DNA primase